MKMLCRFFPETRAIPGGFGYRSLAVLTALSVFMFLALAPAVHAGEGTAPSWMTVDAAKKKVEFHIITAWNANNSAWNFNGYFEGGATIVVPVGWQVKITLLNQDGNYPHSMVLTKPYARDEMPDRATRKDAAIPRAFTLEPEKGLFAGHKDGFRFKAKKAGKYYLYCGVPGHGLSGMWIKFEISAEVDRPQVIFADGIEPGRP